MEENIIYNDVISIERADDAEQNTIIASINSIYIPKQRKEPTSSDPFADFDFGDN